MFLDKADIHRIYTLLDDSVDINVLLAQEQWLIDKKTMAETWHGEVSTEKNALRLLLNILYCAKHKPSAKTLRALKESSKLVASNVCFVLELLDICQEVQAVS